MNKVSWSDDEKWQAVVEKNPNADGAFFYGVYSTGVCCKPSCVSRPKRRDSVVFFETLQSALSAGFRPCLRCHPASSISPTQAYIDRALLKLQEKDVSLKALAAETPWSVSHFQKIFKERIGVSPKQFAMAEKHRRVQVLLSENASTTTAILDAGFNSLSRFYESSPLGMTPRQYQQGALGMELEFATTQTSLGWVLMAKTSKGLCCTLLGDSASSVLEEFQARFPHANKVEHPEALRDWLETLSRWIALPTHPLSFPLDVPGTMFQHQVWSMLQKIPMGETRSYQEIATLLGNSKASRAVAKACATNPVALTIPCHRVVGQNGALSGYRWGVERKRWLLDREKKTQK